MKTVLVFGTYDVFHKGHEYFLREAAKLGDRLVVVVARDTNVERLKGRLPHDSEDVRLQNVAAFDAVSEARLGYEEWGKHLQVLTDVAPDVIALGYDQKAKLPQEWESKAVRIDSFEPETYKSSKLRPDIGFVVRKK